MSLTHNKFRAGSRRNRRIFSPLGGRVIDALIPFDILGEAEFCPAFGTLCQKRLFQAHNILLRRRLRMCVTINKLGVLHLAQSVMTQGKDLFEN